MTLNLGKAILDCVQTRPEGKFTARQIAEWIFSTYPAECQQKKSNRPKRFHQHRQRPNPTIGCGNWFPPSQLAEETPWN